ncbi:MAG: acyl carrier protein [Thermoguttaceae bacterium]
MSIDSSSCSTIPSHDQIAKDVKAIVAELASISADEIREDHQVFDDLGFDSLDIIECTMEIEEHFDISVPDELGERAKTVGQIIAGVETLLGQPRSDA